MEDKVYFDKRGNQILVGDLLKVFHFRTRNKIYYMYHVVVMDGEQMALRDFASNKPHYKMVSVTQNPQHVYKDAEIISMSDWESKRMKIKIEN